MKCNNCNAQVEIEVEEAFGAENYDTALSKADKLYCDDHWSSDPTAASGSIREAYIENIQAKKRKLGIKIFMPANSSLLNGTICEHARTQFSNLGPTNIAVQQSSVSPGLFDKENIVEHILIGGKEYSLQRTTST